MTSLLKSNLMSFRKTKTTNSLEPKSISSKTNTSKTSSSSERDTSKRNLLEKLSKFGYFLGSKIGEGSYSKVYYTEKYDRNQKCTVEYATKIINRNIISKDYHDKFLPRELLIIKRLNHPNIIFVHSTLELGPYICLVMDYCRNGDLLEYIKRRGRLSENRTKLYFSQLISALHYLHGNGISHRDIKCENILLSSMATIKLSDFGFAKNFFGRGNKVMFSETFCGSAAYAAPEVIKGIPYNPKSYDMWSLGVVLYIMITGTMPYNDENIRSIVEQQESGLLMYPENILISKSFKKIISKLLEPNVTKRWQIENLVQISWFMPK